MGVRFFFDEGLAHKLATGLGIVGYNVEHVIDNFPAGTKDSEWLKYVSEKRLVLVTKDKGIRRKPNERAMLLKYGIVAFYLGGSEKSGHNILKQLVNAWKNMEAKAQKSFKTGKAGAFTVRSSGGKIVPIPLT